MIGYSFARQDMIDVSQDLHSSLTGWASLPCPGAACLPQAQGCHRVLASSKPWRQRWRSSGPYVLGLLPLLLASFACGILPAAPPRSVSWDPPFLDNHRQNFLNKWSEAFFTCSTSERLSGLTFLPFYYAALVVLLFSLFFPSFPFLLL